MKDSVKFEVIRAANGYNLTVKGKVIYKREKFDKNMNFNNMRDLLQEIFDCVVGHEREIKRRVEIRFGE